jgi:hypothetical protein
MALHSPVEAAPRIRHPPTIFFQWHVGNGRSQPTRAKKTGKFRLLAREAPMLREEQAVVIQVATL